MTLRLVAVPFGNSILMTSARSFPVVTDADGAASAKTGSATGDLVRSSVTGLEAACDDIAELANSSPCDCNGLLAARPAPTPKRTASSPLPCAKFTDESSAKNAHATMKPIRQSLAGRRITSCNLGARGRDAQADRDLVGHQPTRAGQHQAVATRLEHAVHELDVGRCECPTRHPLFGAQH